MNADDELISEIGAKYLLCMIIRQVSYYNKCIQ